MPQPAKWSDSDRWMTLCDGADYALRASEDAETLTRIEWLARTTWGGNLTARAISDLPDSVPDRPGLETIRADVERIAARYGPLLPPTTKLFAAAQTLTAHAKEARAAMLDALGEPPAPESSPVSSWDIIAPLLKELADERKRKR